MYKLPNAGVASIQQSTTHRPLKKQDNSLQYRALFTVMKMGHKQTQPFMLRKISAFALLGFTLAACNYTGDKHKHTTTQQPDTTSRQPAIATGDNAQNALDWSGTYEATLPCADCPGIKTILTLNSDQTFQISKQYLKNHTEETTTEDTGRFEWQKNGSIIHLKGKETDLLLQVGENRLMALDKRGEDMGSQKDHYIFTKKY